MSVIVCILSLGFLMFVAYRGFSVILFAPIAAMIGVILTEPSALLPIYSGLFMNKMVVFIENYFPVFLLGAVFGKLIEMSGFAQSIVSTAVRTIGRDRAILSIAIVGALLTYGGVSLFVVVFALYPFAVEMFRSLDIPKRLIPATIIFGSATFTMDALPGSPQIQNIIPTSFFNTTTYAAPTLGIIGAIVIFTVGLSYLNWRRKSLQAHGEGYGVGHTNEPEHISDITLPNPILSITPLLLVGVVNLFFTHFLPTLFPAVVEVQMNSITKPVIQKLSSVKGIWSVEIALVVGILFVVVAAFPILKAKFAEGSKAAVGGALLATMNTASEYGFGSVIAALPGFVVIRDSLSAIPNPLLNEAITVNVLAGITGSASGGMSIALAAMSEQFIAAANTAGIPLEVLHRIASMASGGMDTLPHNGVIITILAICGLTHRQSYPDIFALTCIKTSTAFLMVGVYYLTGLV